MRRMELRNGKKIGEGYPPYVIAEMNSSHNGSTEKAKEMVEAAKGCGCDCVKFQSWSSESLYSKEYYDLNPISQRIVKKFSLGQEQLYELSVYCGRIGIDFSSTPYSEKEADFLVDTVKAPFVKIASMEINNLPFIRHIAGKGIPIMLSTGMSTVEEIKAAVRAIEKAGNVDLCILHCVSVYPARPEIVNLNNIRMLRDEFGDHCIGYSDHTVGCEAAAAAIALGSVVVEKHFTLDNKRMGMDNNMATEPDQMKELVRACHNVHMALGGYERELSEEEVGQLKKMRRSVTSRRDLASGTVLSLEDLEAKRPGDGIPPDDVGLIIGKVLKKDVRAGYKITLEDIRA